MKILIIQDDFPPFEHGGAGVMAGLVAKGYVSVGHEVFVICTVQNKELVGEFIENGVKIYRIYSQYHERWRPYVSLFNWRTVFKIDKIIKDICPDVIHLHNIHAHISYYAIIIAKKYTDKIFLTAHDVMSFYQGTLTSYIDPNNLSIPDHFDYKISWLVRLKNFKKRFNPFHNIAVKYFLSKINKIIAVSFALKDALTANGIKNVIVIHNGIDYKNWQTKLDDALDYKKILGFENNKLILFGGRLSGAKGGYLIIRAMSLVLARCPEARLIIFGKKDHYAEKILSFAKNEGIDYAIYIVGWEGEESLKKQYSIADVVVVPSVCFDSFPTVNLQALASHKPVVATCFGGSSEIIKDGYNGRIINPHNVDSLAGAISDILADEKKAKQLGDLGFELLVKEFSLEEMTDNYLRLFRE